MRAEGERKGKLTFPHGTSEQREKKKILGGGTKNRPFVRRQGRGKGKKGVTGKR